MAEAQTFEITAPNGKTLEVSGDHVPSESELREIFSKAGVETSAKPFVPKTAKDFIDRMGRAAVDVPIGAFKNFGSMVQAIPGVAAATDAVYGLPKGASKEAMKPTNDTQKAGALVGDLATAVATGGAEVGGPMLSRAAGYVSNPTVAERGMAALRAGAGFAGDTLAALKGELATGPVTPEKVARLIVKYGKDAVKGALVAGGGYGAWRTVRHLIAE